MFSGVVCFLVYWKFVEVPIEKYKHENKEMRALFVTGGHNSWLKEINDLNSSTRRRHIHPYFTDKKEEIEITFYQIGGNRGRNSSKASMIQRPEFSWKMRTAMVLMLQLSWCFTSFIRLAGFWQNAPTMATHCVQLGWCYAALFTLISSSRCGNDLLARQFIWSSRELKCSASLHSSC